QHFSGVDGFLEKSRGFESCRARQFSKGLAPRNQMLGQSARLLRDSLHRLRSCIIPIRVASPFATRRMVIVFESCCEARQVSTNGFLIRGSWAHGVRAVLKFWASGPVVRHQ